MTWWLSASPAELKEARTCRQCGSGDADIDLNLCFDCFGKFSESERWRRNADVARKYGDVEREAECMGHVIRATKKEREAADGDDRSPQGMVAR